MDENVEHGPYFFRSNGTDYLLVSVNDQQARSRRSPLNSHLFSLGVTVDGAAKPQSARKRAEQVGEISGQVRMMNSVDGSWAEWSVSTCAAQTFNLQQDNMPCAACAPFVLPRGRGSSQPLNPVSERVT